MVHYSFVGVTSVGESLAGEQGKSSFERNFAKPVGNVVFSCIRVVIFIDY